MYNYIKKIYKNSYINNKIYNIYYHCKFFLLNVAFYLFQLHEIYKKVCKKRNIFAVDGSEFVNLCSLIETRGILKVVGRKEARLCKVNLQWDQEELDAALQDKQMMADIINDTSCL